LAYEEKDLEWSKDDEHLDLQIEDSLEDRLESDEEQNEISKTQKASIGRTIYDRLKEEDKDITQSDIADAIEVDRSTLAQA